MSRTATWCLEWLAAHHASSTPAPCAPSSAPDDPNAGSTSRCGRPPRAAKSLTFVPSPRHRPRFSNGPRPACRAPERLRHRPHRRGARRSPADAPHVPVAHRRGTAATFLAEPNRRVGLRRQTTAITTSDPQRRRARRIDLQRPLGRGWRSTSPRTSVGSITSRRVPVAPRPAGLDRRPGRHRRPSLGHPALRAPGGSAARFAGGGRCDGQRLHEVVLATSCAGGGARRAPVTAGPRCLTVSAAHPRFAA